MKLLFVAFPFSVHTARWLNQLTDSGFEIHLISSMDHSTVHPEIKGIIYHENFFDYPGTLLDGNQVQSIQFSALSFFKSSFPRKFIRKMVSFLKLRKTREVMVKEIIEKIQPDIIHSFEMQHAGYLISRVKKSSVGNFPLWIHSNWGIDLHFFSKLKKHIPLIKDALSSIDIFIVEGKRDEFLCREFGFKGIVKTFASVGGGFSIPDVQLSKTSSRKLILIKGMQDVTRRGLVGMRALERCADLLDGFEIVLYSSNEITEAAAELFYANTGKKIRILKNVSRGELLELNASARLNIGINMSDGLPNTMLEAMVMGAFPIQSNTSLADEWIVDGITGMIVPPEDPDIIEAAIRKALLNDAMVDSGAIVNRKKIKEELDYKKIKDEAIQLYLSSIQS